MRATTLAYVADDGTLTLRPIDEHGVDDPVGIAAGSDRERLVGPTWSPTGALAVSRTGRDAEKAPTGEFQLHTAQQRSGRLLFRNPPNAPTVMAPGVAHYAAWSHNGRRVALIAPGAEQLQLYLLEPSLADPEVPPRPLLSGAPMIFAWSPDDRLLAIHCGNDLLLIDAAAVEAGAEPDEARHPLISDVPTYRAPSWTVDGASIIYAAPRAQAGNTLWTVRRDGSDRGAIADLDGVTALSRAPARDLLALVTLSPAVAAGHDLRLLDLQAETIDPIETGPVTAAFWAPDGSALYYFVPSSEDGEYVLRRWRLADRSRQWLTRFRPSAHFLTLLSFYDQYAHSHHLLSPDGRWLTLGGIVPSNGTGGRLGFAPQPGCYILPTDGSGPPQRIAAAEIGFFSPVPGLLG